jgi:hypothetical protein
MRTFVAVALLLTLGCACGCKRSELDTLHSRWKKLPLSPLADSYYLQQAVTSQCAWYVHSDGGGITIERISIKELQHPSQIRAEFAGGTLVGEDQGEWGGNLSVLEGSNRTAREILNKNVLQMVSMKDGVAVITGDLPSNVGSAWLYSNADGHGWSIQKKAELHGFPKIIGSSGERILLGYGDAISIMDDFHERRITGLPMMELQPGSIAQDARGDIYIGMNAFVVRLVSNRDGYLQQWFTQDGCLK